jgi:hypothetical protein
MTGRRPSAVPSGPFLRAGPHDCVIEAASVNDRGFTLWRAIGPDITPDEDMAEPYPLYYASHPPRRRGKMVGEKARTTHDLSHDMRHYP